MGQSDPLRTLPAMPRIRVLDPHVVNQIAAGEVVERPASVVKELVENALDAGARRVDVIVVEGGRALIEVSDDGWGMSREDLQRVFLPHATSKISAVDDLTHIGTLGFRGEAIASIGSVARVTITSREADSESGHRIQNREGDIGPVEPAAGSPGTVVRVENLFAHVPARRKFLRTPATEVGHINDQIQRFSLSFPHVAFRLRHGDRVLFDAPAGEDRAARIARVVGSVIAPDLVAVEDAHDEPSLEGWIGPPSVTRRDGRFEQVFLNGRHVRDRTVSHAIREAYRDLIPPGGRRPIAFLFLTCDPALVDVNVHPTKVEVRWRDSRAAHRVVRRTLRTALERTAPGTPIPLAAPVEPAHVAETLAFAFTRSSAQPRASLPLMRTSAAAPAPTVAAESDEPPVDRTEEGLRPLGQALGTYLLLEGKDEIVLIDQHALHERVLFDQINERLRRDGNLEVQRFLVPSVVHVGAAASARLLEHADLWQRLGWDLAPFGEDAVAVRGAPAVWKKPDPERAVHEFLEMLDRKDLQAGGAIDRAAFVSEAIDSLACRSAVMAGDRLHPDEVLALLRQAEALNHQHSCPHGRPTRLTMTRAQLERWFHRAV